MTTVARYGLPVVGAIAGAFIGGPQGMAAGWLIGSWVGNTFFAAKNKIFDPGAQEMPRFNTALRGVTMPILFGTNRVSSQIVWQNNFQAIRRESGGGGKSGGSGGGAGKGGAGQGGQVSYDYKWDMIYHMGMVHVPMALIGAWVGSQRMADATVAAIAGGGADVVELADGEDTPSKGTMKVAGAEGQEGEQAVLSFTEALFYPGNSDESFVWPHFEGVIGHPIVWPSTVWVGFKELELGASPTIPQITWEIGPVDATQTLEPQTGNGVRWTHTSYGFLLGLTMYQHHVCYTSTGIGVLDDTGTELVHYTMQNLVDMVEEELADDVIGTAFLSVPGYPSVVNGGKNFVICFNYLLAGDNWTTICAFDCNADGSLSVVGAYRFRKAVITGAPNARNGFIMDGGVKDDEAPLYMVAGYGSTSEDHCLLLFPSISEFRSRTANVLQMPQTAPAAYSYATYEISIIQFNLNQMSWFEAEFASSNNTPQYLHHVMLPQIDVVTGTITDQFYFYASTPVMDGHTVGGINKVDWYVTNQPTYPDGFWSKFTFPSQTMTLFCAAHIVASGVHTHTSSYDPVVANDDFVDEDGQPCIPFSDEGKDSAGNTNRDLGYYARWNTEKLASGGYVLYGCKYDYPIGNLNTTNGFGIRVFIYDPIAGKFTLYGFVEGNLFTHNDIGLTSGLSNQNMDTLGFLIYRNGQKLIGCSSNAGGAGNELADMVFSLEMIPLFKLAQGTDLTPPEIIKEVMVNPIFGAFTRLGYGYSSIETTSYDEAVQYCRDNGFYVSTQYRREEGALQIIELLLMIYGGYVTINNDGLIKFGILSKSATPVRTIDNHHLLIDKNGEPPVSINKGAVQDTYNLIRVNYQDRNLDYQQNQVEESDEVDQDFNGVKLKEFPPQFVMTGYTARNLALRTLLTVLHNRQMYSFKLGPKDQDLEPGDVITLVDSYNIPPINEVVRIVAWDEVDRLRFNVKAVQEIDYISSYMVSSGFDVSSPTNNDFYANAIRPPFEFNMYELPKEFSLTDTPKLYVGYVPDGRASGAELHLSVDGNTYAPAASLEPYPLYGKLMTGMPNNEDLMSNVRILLAPASSDPASQAIAFTETMADVNAAGRAVGAGLLWIGSEMVAYETVTLVGSNIYNLGRVYRGWGNTNIHAHSAGAYFWKHGGGVFVNEYNADQVGRTVYYKVLPYNFAGQRVDVSSVTGKAYTIQGLNFKPPPFSNLWWVWSGYNYRGTHQILVNSTIDLEVQWRDHNWMSGYGQGGFGDNTYGHNTSPASKNWLVEIVGSGGAVVHSTAVDTAIFTYPGTINISENGAWRGNLGVRVTPFNSYGLAPRSAVMTLDLFT